MTSREHRGGLLNRVQVGAKGKDRVLPFRAHLDAVVQQSASMLAASHHAFQHVVCALREFLIAKPDFGRSNHNLAGITGRPLFRRRQDERRTLNSGTVTRQSLPCIVAIFASISIACPMKEATKECAGWL